MPMEENAAPAPVAVEGEGDSSVASPATEARPTEKRLQRLTLRTQGSMGRKAERDLAVVVETLEEVVEEGRRASAAAAEAPVLVLVLHQHRSTVRPLVRPEEAAAIDAHASPESPRRRKPSHNLKLLHRFYLNVLAFRILLILLVARWRWCATHVPRPWC